MIAGWSRDQVLIKLKFDSWFFSTYRQSPNMKFRLSKNELSRFVSDKTRQLLSVNSFQTSDRFSRRVPPVHVSWWGLCQHRGARVAFPGLQWSTCRTCHIIIGPLVTSVSVSSPPLCPRTYLNDLSGESNTLKLSWRELINENIW